MEASDTSSSKGKVLLATVKGDVHDIGKNLVDIILSNNGYEVVDLGIKVTSTDLIQAIKKEKPDIVGLSGLLVKSAQQMVLTAHDMKQSDISVPILVGGAALSRKFTDQKISKEYEGLVLYAKDAMNGLSLANQLRSPEEFQLLVAEQAQKKRKLSEVAAEAAGISQRASSAVATAVKEKVRSNVSRDVRVFTPSDTKRHLLRHISVSHVEPYINMQMLIGHHLGVKGKIERLLAEGDTRTLQVKDVVDNLLSQAKQKQLISLLHCINFFLLKRKVTPCLFTTQRTIPKCWSNLTSLVRKKRRIFACQTT